MESDKISVAAPGEYDSIEAALNGAKALPNEAGGYWKRKGGGEKDVYHYHKCDLHVNCTRMLTIRKLTGSTKFSTMLKGKHSSVIKERSRKNSVMKATGAEARNGQDLSQHHPQKVSVVLACRSSILNFIAPCVHCLPPPRTLRLRPTCTPVWTLLPAPHRLGF